MAGSIVRVGDVKRVHTDAADYQSATSVTTLIGGGWLVTWTARDEYGRSLGVYQQRYDQNGGAVGPETRINTDTTNV